MNVQELVRWKPVPIGPDPVGPWVSIIDILEKEKQIEIVTIAMEYNRVMIDMQRNMLEAQSKALANMINVIGAKKAGAAR